MSANRNLPIPASNFQPLASTPMPLVSSNRLFNKCKGQRDYRAQTRITFVGAWNNQEDEIFQWYLSQPHRRFQKIEYCKENSGVQHEFIRVLLQDEGGNLVGSFCRIERVADVQHRIEAVTSRGTIAFDIVQTIDPGHPLYPEHPSLTTIDDDVELLGQISFPCVLDLIDILAICYGIHQHPQAKNYTLQQFNCYFFCWTIILCLARHAADWNAVVRKHVGALKEAVLQHVGNLRSCRNFTVWSIMFGLHDNPTDTSGLHLSPSQITQTIVSEIASEGFMNAVFEMLLPLLWHDQNLAKLQNCLSKRLDTVARDTSSPLLANSLLNTAKEPGLLPKMGFGLFQSELVRICLIAWIDRIILGEENSIYIQELKRFHHQRSKQIPSKLRAMEVPIVHLSLLLNLVFSPIGIVCGASLLLTNRYEHEVAIQRQRRSRNPFQKPLALVKTIIHGPTTLCTGLKWYSRDFCRFYHELSSGGLSSGAWDTWDTYSQSRPKRHRGGVLASAIRILSESLSTYGARHTDISIDDLRSKCLETMEYFCRTRLWSGLHHTMSDLWTLSFRDDVGSVIVKTILGIINQPRSGFSYFGWAHKPIAHSSHVMPGADVRILQLSHSELQNRIRERIVQLSKWEVEGSPITPYMRHVPFAIPAKGSQAQMERAIESIWSTCGPLMKRNGPE